MLLLGIGPPWRHCQRLQSTVLHLHKAAMAPLHLAHVASLACLACGSVHTQQEAMMQQR
jgi:hypothetical protein